MINNDRNKSHEGFFGSGNKSNFKRQTTFLMFQDSELSDAKNYINSHMNAQKASHIANRSMINESNLESLKTQGVYR